MRCNTVLCSKLRFDLSKSATNCGLAAFSHMVDSIPPELVERTSWRLGPEPETDTATSGSCARAHSALCDGALGRSLAVAGYNFLYVIKARLRRLHPSPVGSGAWLELLAAGGGEAADGALAP